MQPFLVLIFLFVHGMMAHPYQPTSHAVHTRRHVLNAVHVQIPVNTH